MAVQSSKTIAARFKLTGDFAYLIFFVVFQTAAHRTKFQSATRNGTTPSKGGKNIIVMVCRSNAWQPEVA
jgi:hypothetical protein